MIPLSPSVPSAMSSPAEPLPSSVQFDALRETANIGAGHAATALSQMTGRVIQIKVPTLGVADGRTLPLHLTPEEEPVAAVQMEMRGDLSGRTLLVFPKATVMRLAELMLRRPLGSSVAFSELEASAIKEAGNILGGTYMNALSELLCLTLLPSPPTLLIDLSRAVLLSAFGPESEDAGSVLCVESEFLLDAVSPGLRGFFLLQPTAESLQRLLHALRVA